MPTCLPLQQHPNFASALRLLGREMRMVDLPGAAPIQIMSRFGLRLASRGPIWHRPPTPEDSRALRKSRLHIINSDGQDHDILKSAGFRQIKTPSYVAELSLTGTPKTRLAAMKSKWRNTLRRAESAPFSIQRELFTPRRHGWLLEEDLKQQKEKGFRSLPHTLLGAYGVANPRDQLVFVAYIAATPIAAMLFLIHGNVATYHLGWLSDLGRKHAAHNALLVRASNYLAKQSIKRLDMGTVDTVNAPGLARFKIGSGADIRPLGGTWLRVPSL